MVGDVILKVASVVTAGEDLSVLTVDLLEQANSARVRTLVHGFEVSRKQANS